MRRERGLRGRGECRQRKRRDGVIETVFYPAFPPDRNASDVLARLVKNK